MPITQARMIALVSAADEAISRDKILSKIANEHKKQMQTIIDALRNAGLTTEHQFYEPINELLEIVENLIEQTQERISVDALLTLERERYHFEKFEKYNDKNRGHNRRYRAKLQHNTSE